MVVWKPKGEIQPYWRIIITKKSALSATASQPVTPHRPKERESRSCLLRTLRQAVGAAHQRPVQEEKGDGGDRREHIHGGGLLQIGVTHQLEIDLGGQGAGAPADDDGGAKVRQRADEGEKQAHQNTGAHEREDHIFEDIPRTGRPGPERPEGSHCQFRRGCRSGTWR